MLRRMLRSKIHRATVTRTDMNYEGSITIDAVLLEAAGLISYEAVWIWDIMNGERFETYVLAGKRDSGDICLNGAAARKVYVGDLIIIAAFGLIDENSITEDYVPSVVSVDAKNRLIPVSIQTGDRVIAREVICGSPGQKPVWPGSFGTVATVISTPTPELNMWWVEWDQGSKNYAFPGDISKIEN